MAHYDNRDSQSNMFGAAMMGAVLGALGTAAILWDDRRRNQIKRSVAELREKGEDTIEDVGERVDDIKGGFRRMTGKAKKKVNEEIDKTQSRLGHSGRSKR